MSSAPTPNGRAGETAGALDARAPSRAEALEAEWRAYFEHAAAPPAHPAARDFLYQDVATSLRRMIPADATVLEAGCAEGDLLASLPNPRRRGVDYLPPVVARARARHPDIAFDVEDVTAAPGAGAPAEAVQGAGWDAVICDRLCHSVLDV